MGGEILLLLFFLFFRVCGKTRSTRVGLVGCQPGERRNCAQRDAAALRLAGTFDAQELARPGLRGVQPDPKQARRWYERGKLTFQARLAD